MERRQRNAEGFVTCVITFEELQALLDGLEIGMEKLQEEDLVGASYLWAETSRKAEAVAEVLQARLNSSRTPGSAAVWKSASPL